MDGSSPPRRLSQGWTWLLVGLVLSFAFHLTATLRFMGWLLASLFHETGHVAMAWYAGCPAYPAISLQGHAMAVHRDQSGAVCLAVGLLLAFAVHQAWTAGRLRRTALAGLLLWPLVAFVPPFREIAFLLAGHLGELLFAAVFLWRAGSGMHVEQEAERPFYACLGWFLIARNVILSFGLAFLPSAREAYLHNGSFGLLNDYARIAHDHLHVPLAAVGVVMLVLSLATFPILLAVTRDRSAPRARDVAAGLGPPIAF